MGEDTVGDAAGFVTDQVVDGAGCHAGPDLVVLETEENRGEREGDPAESPYGDRQEPFAHQVAQKERAPEQLLHDGNHQDGSRHPGRRDQHAYRALGQKVRPEAGRVVGDGEIPVHGNPEKEGNEAGQDDRRRGPVAAQIANAQFPVVPPVPVKQRADRQSPERVQVQVRGGREREPTARGAHAEEFLDADERHEKGERKDAADGLPIQTYSLGFHFSH